MPQVTIQNTAETIEVPPNKNLREALMAAKEPLYDGFHKIVNCHGKGLCASCEVLVIEGAEHLTERTPKEVKKLKTWDATRRLACQCAIIGDKDITINTLAL
ncbi:MAG TPA: (2Fe-2S)-binding protein [Planctomycetes bacterium]|nr:(2Fe-2S)-binding protein [Planctomycetota bacterium]